MTPNSAVPLREAADNVIEWPQRSHRAMAVRHIELLTGDPGTPMCFRLFRDDKSTDEAENLNGTLAECWDRIVELQEAGWGAFIVVNEGGQRDRDITRVRALFIDGDKELLPADCHLMPSFFTMRDADHWHLYWPVSDMPVAAFREAQKRLSAHYRSDPKVCNPSRVMRLAGTVHLKDPANPKLVTIYPVSGEAKSYTAAEVLDGLPELPPKAARVEREVPDDFEPDQPIDIERAKRYLAGQEVPIEGQGSDTACYRHIAMLRDFGLTEGMILNLMTEWTGFEDDWLQGKLDSADTYSQNTAGCKSFAVEYPAAAASLAANKITMEQALGYWKKVADGVEKYGRSQEEAEVEALAYLEKERAKAKSEDDACVRDANIGAELTTAVGSDDHLACLFTEAHSNYFRYVHEHGKWREFDGHCWIEAAYPLVCDLVRGQARIMAQEIAATDEKISPSTLRGFTSGQKISAGEKLARGTPGILISHSAFDADPRCFNTPAGIVDGNGLLVTRGLAERYCTKSAAVAPGGDCTQWRRFLDEITDGDKELQAYLQRMAGYCLTGLTDEQVMFFLYGTGANGKGVFINTLSAIWADYARVAPADTFTQHFGDRHPTDMAMLQGARLVTAQETNEGQAWDEAKIKALTGGDPISARLMRQDFFTYQPQFKLVIAGNHKPRLRVVDEAIRRRLHMIPFAVTIPPESRDGQLQEKLKTEWSGILQWAIEGMLEWKRIGLTPPRAVLDLTEAYLATQDRLADWIEDCCVVGRQEWASGADLYRSFIGHPAAQDGDRLGPKQFGDLLESHDFKRAKRGHDGVRGYSGLALKDIET